MATILLAVAANDQREFLAEQLAADTHDLATAGDYAQALFAAQTDIVTAAIVDLSLPAQGALRLIREIRAAEHHDLSSDLPILVILAAGAGDLELVRAYEAGADDVACRDASYPEVRCRLASLLRRAIRTSGTARRRRVGCLELDLGARAATVDGSPVELSKLEFDLLSVLSGEPTRVFTKVELLRHVWGIPEGISTRTLDSHACRLRRKLADAGGQGLVANTWGYGYALTGPR